MRLHLPPLLLLAALLLPRAAHADPRDDARRHFAAGLDAAAARDFQRAIDEFLAAYEAIPHPSTAWNVARSYEDAGDLVNARIWYRRVGELAPERAGEVRDAIARIDARLGPPPAPGLESVESARARLEALEAERRQVIEALGRMGVVVETAPATPAEPASAVPVEAEPAAQEAPDAPQEASVAEVPPDAEAQPVGGGFLEDPYERVIVSASRYSEDPLDAPSSVTVLTAEDIRMSGAIHIADVLRRVVGVDVMAMSSGAPWVGMRGVSSEMNNKVLWLVDGRPANLEFLATAFPFTLQVGLDEIERIEVIRGPGSATYGANAVSGVVNIITKRPGEGAPFEASMSAGINRFVAGSATSSGRMGPIAYRFGAGYQQEGRFSKALEEIDPDGPITPWKTDQDLGDRRVRADARFDGRFADKGWASLSGGWSSGFTEYLSKAALGNFGLEGETGHVRGDLAYGPVHVRAYWMIETGVTAPWLSSAGSARSTMARVKDEVADVEAEGNWQVNTGEVQHRLHIGAGYTFKQYRAGVPGEGFEIPRREHHAKVFGQYGLKWRWFQALGSLRWDRHPLLEADAAISPRGALVFRVARDVSVRASAGTAFRVMNGLESYVNLDLNTAADGYFVRFLGAGTDPEHRTLQPERITTVELGARDESTRFHQLDVAVYWNRLTNLIDIGAVRPVLEPFDPDGQGYAYGESGWINSPTEYDTVGGEIDLRLFPVDGLDVYANASIVRVWAREPDGTTTIDASTGLAHVNAGVLYRSPIRLDVTLSAHYVSDQRWRIPTFGSTGEIVMTEEPLPGRVLLVGRLAGRPTLNPDLELGVTIWNPLGFGKSFREHPNGHVLAPRLYGTATLKF